jgi:hypothetical protein
VLLGGERLRIDWDFEKRGGDRWTVLRHGGREIGRGLAYWEGHDRFEAVFAILPARYGPRRAATPEPASGARSDAC